MLDRIIQSDFWNPATPLGALLYAVLFVVAAWGINQGLKFALKRAIQRDRRGLVDRTAAPFLMQVTGVLVYLLALLLYAHLVPELRSMGNALLTGVSVSAVVIGLAAQNTLSNLIAGFALLIYRPFQVGDRVQITAPTGVEMGTVETVSLGYTILVTGDNRRLVVPNSAIANQVTLNLTAVDPRAHAVVPIGIGYSSDVEKARQILLELAGKHPDVIEVVGCPLTSLGDSSVVLTLRAWCAEFGASKKVEFDLYEQAKQRFDAAGIEIPFPYRNVIMQQSAA